MKKLLSMIAAAIIAATSFTSCMDSDSDDSGTTYTGYVTTAYSVNAGQWHSGDGSLTKITGMVSYTSSSVSMTAQNQTNLGELPNDIMIYGNKLYVVGTGTNSIYVYNKKTLSLISQISTDGLMGDAGEQPRCITGAGGNIYVTTYGVADGTPYSSDAKGYVAVIDTVNYSLKAQYEVGPYPEDIVAAYTGSNTSNYTIYVANSDYAQGNGSISSISVKSGTASSPLIQTFDAIKNPTKLGIAGTLWIQESATYNADYTEKTSAAIYQWDGSTAPVKVVDAAMMAPVVLTSGYSYAYRVYFISDPYGTPSYGYYDYSSKITTKITGISGISLPNAIDVDPYTGYIYIGTAAGEINVYSYDGTPVKVGLSAGAYPTAFAFDSPTMIVANTTAN